jgi:proline racemase
MDLTRIEAAFAGRWPGELLTVDSHTAGEGTRLIVGGVPHLPGMTMAQKRAAFMERHDHVRLLLTREPRGHRDLLAAAVTAPCTPGADFGLIYMDARRYPQLCGHATIGAVTTLIECGALPVSGGEEVRVVVDTPAGPMPCTARMRAGRVESVAFRSVPSFVWEQDALLDLTGLQPRGCPPLGVVRADTVCVGGFFVMIDERSVGLELHADNGPSLVELGMRIIDEANRQLTVRHPLRGDVHTVDVVEFHGRRKTSEGEVGVNAVVYGEAHLDRSPCGTGTTAKLALLHRRGDLPLYQPYVNRSFLGSTFTGRVVEESLLGGIPAIVAEIEGSAQVTGLHRFVLDETDPFPQGLLL